MTSAGRCPGGGPRRQPGRSVLHPGSHRLSGNRRCGHASHRCFRRVSLPAAGAATPPAVRWRLGFAGGRRAGACATVGGQPARPAQAACPATYVQQPPDRQRTSQTGAYQPWHPIRAKSDDSKRASLHEYPGHAGIPRSMVGAAAKTVKTIRLPGAVVRSRCPAHPCFSKAPGGQAVTEVDGGLPVPRPRGLMGFLEKVGWRVRRAPRCRYCSSGRGRRGRGG